MKPSLELVSPELGPPSATARRLVRELQAKLPELLVSTAAADRVAASRDLWPKLLLHRRAGRVPRAPELVVWPRSIEEIVGLLAFAREKGVPVTPYGAGSGVCGGAIPLGGAISLDLKRMDRVLSIDRATLTLHAEAGVIGLPLEQRLAARGLTLGHFPSSIMTSTVGGWVAARSAGQCSARYGKIEDMVTGLTVVLGTGEVVTPKRPATGPDLCELFLGSEGTLGVIADATLRLFPAPEAQLPRGFRFPNLGRAIEALRTAFRAGLRPAVARLYDPVDTAIALGHAAPPEPSDARPSRLASLASALGGAAKRELASVIASPKAALEGAAVRGALRNISLFNRAAGLLEPCLLVVVHEGIKGPAELEAEKLRAVCEAHGAVDLGEEPGRRWLRKRYDVSFKLPVMFTRGAWVDTCEVACPWSRLEETYDAVRRAVAPHAFVMAHMSHAWLDGCSIYFSFSGPAGTPEEGLASYERAWDAAMEAVVASGASITHHHGVGLLRAPHLARELSPGGVALLHAAKQACDPAGILNPGKLV